MSHSSPTAFVQKLLIKRDMKAGRGVVICRRRVHEANVTFHIEFHESVSSEEGLVQSTMGIKMRRAGVGETCVLQTLNPQTRCTIQLHVCTHPVD
jgi:hypothetical protein